MSRQVTLVCGPPCGGKSTWVDKHAAKDDLILCLDRLAQEAGSNVAHNHDGHMYGRAQRRYDQLVHQVRNRWDVTAWVIRCAPDPKDRQAIAEAVKATRTVVLVPPMQETFLRTYDRMDAVADTCKAITAWYRRYGPNPGEEVITD